jgi:hypothetical protein
VRSLLGFVIVSLLLVPALARAQQSLDSGRTPTASFSKSVDVPPDTVIVAPDLSVTLIDIDAVLHPGELTLVADDRLPAAPDLLDTDALRGPPAAVTLR